MFSDSVHNVLSFVWFFKNHRSFEDLTDKSYRFSLQKNNPQKCLQNIAGDLRGSHSPVLGTKADPKHGILQSWREMEEGDSPRLSGPLISELEPKWTATLVHRRGHASGPRA